MCKVGLQWLQKPECQQFGWFGLELINLPNIKTLILLTDSHIFLVTLDVRIYWLINIYRSWWLPSRLTLLMLSGEFRLRINLGKLKFSHFSILWNARTASPYDITNNGAIHELWNLPEHYWSNDKTIILSLHLRAGKKKQNLRCDWPTKCVR